jgi:hypothetical protein
VVQDSLYTVNLEFTEDWVVVVKAKVAHVDLNLFSFRLLAGINLTPVYISRSSEFLSNFEEALLDFSFDARLELLLHVVKF